VITALRLAAETIGTFHKHSSLKIVSS